MKTLHLIRHAKSSWDNPALADIERPLNSRGYKSCRLMAEPIYQSNCNFSHVYCSVAIRAQQTIQGIKDSLPNIDFDWTLDKALYTFSSRDLLTWCHQLNDDFDDILLIAHNPAITDLCNELSTQFIKNVPTCAYVQINVEGNHWADLQTGCASIKVFLSPRKISKI